MKITISERRAVLRAMHEHGCHSSLSGMEVDRIAHRTPGSRGTMGVARTRACIKAEIAEGRVRRRRSFWTEYVYWLTEEGVAWLSR